MSSTVNERKETWRAVAPHFNDYRQEFHERYCCFEWQSPQKVLRIINGRMLLLSQGGSRWKEGGLDSVLASLYLADFS